MKVRFIHNTIHSGSRYVCGSVAEVSKESATVLIKDGFATECTAADVPPAQEKTGRRTSAAKSEPAAEEEGFASFDGTQA